MKVIKNNYKAYLGCLFILFFLFSCRDFKEMDISNEKVYLITPPDSSNTETMTQTFWWMEVKEADLYEFQIVSPEFDNIKKLELDTILKINKFTYTLKPGKYQWRVRAKSDETYTSYSVNTLTIDTANTLKNQIVVLVSPSSNFLTNNTSILFKWNLLEKATDYWIKIKKNGDEIISQTLKRDTITFQLTHGSYSWQVKAMNSDNDTETPFFSANFIIDTEAPIAPTLKIPSDLDTISINTLPINFSWSFVASNQSELVLSKNDTTSLFPSFPVNLSDSTFIWNPTTGATQGTYFWKVRNKDNAGNVGAYSVWRKFILE